jgi:hypothetical protein
MNRITINGVTYEGVGSISVIDGVVTIDGKRQDGTVSGVVEIRVLEGVLGELRTDAAVNCGKVRGNVHAGGSVRCEDVGGSVNAGGSVRCDTVNGSVNAGGSVRHG